MNQIIDWPGIRAAAVAIGVREAARRAAIDLSLEERERFVERVMKRSSREGWLVAANEARIIPTLAENPPSSAPVRNGAEALSQAIADDSRATRAALGRAVRKGAEHLQDQPGAEIVGKAKAVQQLTSAAGQIGGWGERGQDQGTELVILSIGGNVNLGSQSA